MPSHVHSTAELPSALMLQDGSRDFTGRTKGIDPLDAADLVTKRYVDAIANGALVGSAIVGSASVQGAAGGANADRLQGRDIDDAAPEDGDVLTWSEADQAWKPEALPSASAAVPAEGIHEVPLNSFETFAVAADEALFTYTSPVEAAGLRKWHTATRSASPANVERRAVQAMTRAPAAFVAGTALKVRVRLFGDLAMVYTRVDLEAWRTLGKKDAPTEDLVSSAYVALRGYEVGLESLVGAAKVGESPPRDIEFTLDGSKVESGEPVTLVLRVEYDNRGSPETVAGEFFLTWLALIVGPYGWRVGSSSMIGSALVG